jgi:hypothetical protein
MSAVNDGKRYDVFVRNWWRENPAWPNGLEPDGSGRRHYIARRVTEAEALALCREYRAKHAPGRLSRKAEYTES